MPFARFEVLFFSLLYIVDDRMINEYGAVDGMRIVS
jgi:hypothetical protein